MSSSLILMEVDQTFDIFQHHNPWPARLHITQDVQHYNSARILQTVAEAHDRKWLARKASQQYIAIGRIPLELERTDVSKVRDSRIRIVKDELAGMRVFLAPKSLLELTR